jgi:hypothetical protein
MSPAANQTAYLVKLQGRRQVAERTIAFQFEKPEGFTFKAGLSIDMTLMNPSETDGEGDGRTFSIASAPDEGMLLLQSFDAALQNRPDKVKWHSLKPALDRILTKAPPTGSENICASHITALLPRKSD